MRIVAYRHLQEYWERHSDAKAALLHWRLVVTDSYWQTPREALKAFSKAKVLNGERVRFEIEGGNFRLIAASNFRRQIAYVKFIGTRAEYERIDALTVSMF